MSGVERDENQRLHAKHSKRRRNVKFEPFFDPSFDEGLGRFVLGDWSVATKTKKAFRQVFNLELAQVQTSPSGLPTREVNRRTAVLEGVEFLECAFQGASLITGKIVFVNCRFYRCDFAGTWLHTNKFTECLFDKSSFSLCDMSDAHFRDCSFVSIGFSGGETRTPEVYISNSDEFVSALVMPKGEIPNWARMSFSENIDRFFATQSVMARNLMTTMKSHGSESEYYVAVRSHELAQGRSRYVRQIHDGNRTKALYNFLEYLFVCALGYTNNFGKSPLKPLLLLLFSTLAFAVLYLLVGLAPNIVRALEISFHTSILAGFAYEIAENASSARSWIIKLDGVVSLFLYSVFVATLFGRLSRIK